MDISTMRVSPFIPLTHGVIGRVHFLKGNGWKLKTCWLIDHCCFPSKHVQVPAVSFGGSIPFKPHRAQGLAGVATCHRRNAVWLECVERDACDS